jgi:hypothetical protein
VTVDLDLRRIAPVFPDPPLDGGQDQAEIPVGLRLELDTHPPRFRLEANLGGVHFTLEQADEAGCCLCVANCYQYEHRNHSSIELLVRPGRFQPI